MSREPVFHWRVIAGVPVVADLHNERIFDVSEVAGHAFECSVADIPGEQIGFDEDPKTFGVYPKWPCVLIDRLFQVRQYILNGLRIVFRYGNKHQVILVGGRARNWVAKWIVHGHSFRDSLVTESEPAIESATP